MPLKSVIIFQMISSFYQKKRKTVTKLWPVWILKSILRILSTKLSFPFLNFLNHNKSPKFTRFQAIQLWFTKTKEMKSNKLLCWEEASEESKLLNFTDCHRHSIDHRITTEIVETKTTFHPYETHTTPDLRSRMWTVSTSKIQQNRK